MKRWLTYIALLPAFCFGNVSIDPVVVAHDDTTIGWELSDEELKALAERKMNSSESEIEVDVEALLAPPIKKNKAASARLKKQMASKSLINQAMAMMAPASSYADTTHLGVFHTLLSNSLGIVGIDDGSFWNVYSFDQSLTWNWLTATNSWTPDNVVIAPDYRLFSYPYRLVNQQTGKTVRASLYSKPKPSYLGGNARWIYSLVWLTDVFGNYFVQLCLDDGSVWNMLNVDFSVARTWLVNDVMIIGANRGDFSVVAPNILINASNNSYAAGACILR